MNVQMEAKCGFFHSGKAKPVKPLPDSSLECSGNILKVNGQKSHNKGYKIQRWKLIKICKILWKRRAGIKH